MSLLFLNEERSRLYFWRRLRWEVPLALLILFLILIGIGRQLNRPQIAVPSKPKRILARIYELPPQRAAAPHRRMTPRIVPQHAHAPVATTHPPHPATSPIHSSRPSRKNTIAVPHHIVIPEVPHARHVLPTPHHPSKLTHRHPASAPHRVHRPVQHHPIHKHVQSHPVPRKPTPNLWGHLNSQINAVATHLANHSRFAQVHNPHTLIAKYYMKTLLEKLQRVGDMVYNGQQSGLVLVRLIINASGHVSKVEIIPLAGDSGLKGMAHQIVSLSAPFSPFPARLSKQTKAMKLHIRMEFMGAHSINAW